MNIRQIFVTAAVIGLFIGTAGILSAEEKKEMTIKIFDAESGEYKEVEIIEPAEEKLRDMLTEEQYHVTQEAGTERPFTGHLLNNKEEGIYQCIVCGTDLFLSETKYESGTGWPSFTKPVAKENIGEKEDKSLFMHRVEVHCPRCGAHLGHVFDDGPAPTHKRYCINSVSLQFKAMDDNE